MLSSSWLLQCFPYLRYCLLSNLPQPCYTDTEMPLLAPCDLQSRHLVSPRMEEDSRGISRMYLLYNRVIALPNFYMPSPSLIFTLIFIMIVGTRPHCTWVAQRQNDKDSPYLIDFVVKDLLCWALNQTYMLQGMQVSISLLGAGETSHQTWDGLSSK